MACYSLEILLCQYCRIPAVTHGLCFATHCHLHISSLQDPHDCALTRSSFAISRPSPLPSSFSFSSPLFPSHFHTLIFHALPFPEAISLISSSSGLPCYHTYNFQYISHRNINSVQRPHEPAGRNFLLP